MGYQNKESRIIKKNFDRAEKERLIKKIKIESLKDISLETRREEAKKPLYLSRYE
jgi:hypothetical protein